MRKVERAGSVQPREEKAEGRSHQWVQIPDRRVQGGQSLAPFSGAQGWNKRHWAQAGAQDVPSEHQAVLYCADNQALVQIAQRSEVSICEALRKSIRHGLGEAVLDGPS